MESYPERSPEGFGDVGVSSVNFSLCKMQNNHSHFQNITDSKEQALCFVLVAGIALVSGCFLRPVL